MQPQKQTDQLSAYAIPGMMLEVSELVCAALNVDVNAITKRTRVREICDKRQIVLYFQYKYDHRSLMEIGTDYKLDHATVTHSFYTVRDRMEVYPDYCDTITAIEANFKNYKEKSRLVGRWQTN